MTRLLPVASSIAAIVALVVANLIPLAGVAFWGWSLGSILVLYWVENGVIGILNVGRILLAQGDQGGEADRHVVESQDLTPDARTGRGCVVPFFVLHYGIFWVVHGVFVFAIIGGAFGTDSSAGPTRPDIVIGGTLALAASHVVSFLTNYVGRGEYRTATPLTQMFSVYGRVFVLHITILGGAFLAIQLGSPLGILIVLVIGKTLLDLGLHLREHVRAQRRADPAAS